MKNHKPYTVDSDETYRIVYGTIPQSKEELWLMVNERIQSTMNDPNEEETKDDNNDKGV